MLKTAGQLLQRDPNRIIFLDGRTFSRRYQIDNVVSAAAALHQSWRILECVCSGGIGEAAPRGAGCRGSPSRRQSRLPTLPRSEITIRSHHFAQNRDRHRPDAASLHCSSPGGSGLIVICESLSFHTLRPIQSLTCPQTHSLRAISMTQFRMLLSRSSLGACLLPLRRRLPNPQTPQT